MAPLMKVDPAALRALRLRAGMSIAELARTAGVADGTVDGIEAGYLCRNHMSTARRLAAAFGVEVAELVIFVERDRGEDEAEDAREDVAS